MTELIAPSKSLGYTNLYLDFLAGRRSARHLYASSDIAETATRLDEITYDRERLVTILERQNRSFGASQATMANITRLRDNRTLCIFAGQQACLFGGPLLILIKALAIVKIADRYSRQLGREVVPIFWIDADDHDFEEVNHTFVLDRTGELVRVAYATSPPSPVPLSEITLSDNAELKQAKTTLMTALGESDFTGQLQELIDHCYAPGSNMVTAFAALMAKLTERFGLVLFSPGNAEIKQMAAPFLMEILTRQDELRRVMTDTNRHIEKHGYHLQVHKKDDLTHLFINLEGRQPVVRQGEDYLVSNRRFTHQQLQAQIEQHPEKFSPDVLLRPVMQSYLFPVVAQLGGPSEIAYLAQTSPLFALFDQVAPYDVGRPSLTFVEKRFERIMTEYSISFDELPGDVEQIINRVLATTFPDDLESRFGQMRDDVRGSFDRFLDASLTFDPNLRQFGGQTQGKIDYTLKQFEDKVFAAHKKKSKQTRDRIYRLWHALYPDRGLQERTLNVTCFLSHYGLNFLSFMYDHIDCEQTAHQVVRLSEYPT